MKRWVKDFGRSWKNLQYKNKSFKYRRSGITTYAYTQHSNGSKGYFLSLNWCSNLVFSKKHFLLTFRSYDNEIGLHKFSSLFAVLPQHLQMNFGFEVSFLTFSKSNSCAGWVNWHILCSGILIWRLVLWWWRCFIIRWIWFFEFYFIDRTPRGTFFWTKCIM